MNNDPLLSYGEKEVRTALKLWWQLPRSHPAIMDIVDTMNKLDNQDQLVYLYYTSGYGLVDVAASVLGIGPILTDRRVGDRMVRRLVKNLTKRLNEKST